MLRDFGTLDVLSLNCTPNTSMPSTIPENKINAIQSTEKFTPSKPNENIGEVFLENGASIADFQSFTRISTSTPKVRKNST